MVARGDLGIEVPYSLESLGAQPIGSTKNHDVYVKVEPPVDSSNSSMIGKMFMNKGY